MNEKVQKYFENLEEKKLNTINNIIINDGKRVIQGNIQFIPNCRKSIYSFSIDNTPYIAKMSLGDFALYLHEIASSKMLGDLGIVTPPQNPIRIKVSKTHSKLGLLSQDVKELKNIEATLASTINFFTQLPIHQQFNGYRNLSPWHILTDKDVKEKCLEIMTEKCYEDITNYFFLEELRSACDSHRANYFLYKREGEEKYDGIIPVDLESSYALGFEDCDKDHFNDFLHTAYPSCLPFKNWGDCDQNGNWGYFIYTQTYEKRIEMLKHLIHTGILTNNEIELLRNAINYDFPKLMKDTCEKYHHHIKEKTRNYTSDTISQIWEYNYNELEKELR